jgi:hypothetical protein
MTDAPQQIQIHVPDEVQGGVYANVAIVWHTAYEFTLDFAVLQPVVADANGQPMTPARVVARVKFPPSQIFQLLQAINANMTTYESTFGSITAPGDVQPPAPGDDAV